MGTRSLTRVIETWEQGGKRKKNLFVTVYRQMNGYPSGHGLDLANFISSGKMVNGIGLDIVGRVFNGAGCFAAQLISALKGDSAGSIYICPNSTKDVCQEYEYHIVCDFDTKAIKFICFKNGYMSKGEYIDKKKKLFEGTANEFIEFVEKNEKVFQ